MVFIYKLKHNGDNLQQDLLNHNSRNFNLGIKESLIWSDSSGFSLIFVTYSNCRIGGPLYTYSNSQQLSGAILAVQDATLGILCNLDSQTLDIIVLLPYN